MPELRTEVEEQIAKITTLYARLDGEDVEYFRLKSPTFNYIVPEDDSIYDYFGLVGPQFEGRINPSVADGYWACIPPLPPGKYVLVFGTERSDGTFLNVRYNLTVEDPNQVK